MLNIAERYSFIGKDIPRRDADSKVRGLLEFSTDISVPGMYYGRIVYSPHPFADIEEIDTREAESMGAVVITPKDVPSKPFNIRLVSVNEVTFKDWNILTFSPRYLGDPVAAVAAPSEELAQKAAESIKFKFRKVYDPILDAFESMGSQSAPIREKILKGEEEIPVRRNVGAELNYLEGDLEKGKREADVVIERAFKTNRRYHFQLEPKTSLCVPEHDGRFSIYTTTQTIHNTRILIGQVFGIPLSKISVKRIPIGGSFGSSIQTNLVTLISVALCMKAKKPVKISLTREEDMYDHADYEMHLKLRVGARRSGELTFGELVNIMDIGAHQVQAYPLLGTALGWFVSLYKWKNIKYEGKAVYTNKTPSCAFRGYGAPQISWAVESIMDELAEELGMDPLDLKLKNYVGLGDVFWGQGPTVRSVIRSDGVKELVEKGKQLIGWDRRKPPSMKQGRYRTGIGFGRSFHTSGAGGPISGEVIDYTGATLKLNEDGTLDYITALQDHGGGTLEAHAKIIAEELGVPPHLINIVPSDTSVTPYDVCTHASRGTYVGGEAARRAAQIVKSKVFEAATRILPKAVNPEAFKLVYDETLEQAVVYVEGMKDMRITLSEIARTSWQRNWGTIAATVSYRATSAPPTFTVFFVEVEVDTYTGNVKPKRVVAGADLGTVINPKLAEGQLHGGFVMGWSMAYLEDTIYDRRTGELLNKGMVVDYKIPTSQDSPKLEDFKVIFANTYEPTGPYGAKGLGEAALNPVAGAVANAIYNAVGVRFYTLPITPERILEAISGGGKQ
ncbi:MAG: xanthine dehydrogenase family protein molybdopterin-binding subunit [Fervidicoccaceae archaeon]|jgi:xanthine dehydrogenase molybdenum-binding subunit